MRRKGSTFELRMELAAQEVRMILELDDLHEAMVGAQSRHCQTGLLQGLAVLVVQLIAMPVPLADLGHAVSIVRVGSWREHARIGAKAHGRTLINDAPLV